MVSRAGEAILVDANLVMWAHHSGMPHHVAAREWWATTLAETPLVGIPWATIVAFVRRSKHHRVLERPVSIGDAWDVLNGWLERPNVRCPCRRSATLFCSASCSSPLGPPATMSLTLISPPLRSSGVWSW
jgi:hypothetical protein